MSLCLACEKAIQIYIATPPYKNVAEKLFMFFSTMQSSNFFSIFIMPFLSAQIKSKSFLGSIQKTNGSFRMS